MELFSYCKSYQKNVRAKSRVNGKDKIEQKKFNQGDPGHGFERVKSCLDCIYVHNQMGREKRDIKFYSGRMYKF